MATSHTYKVNSSYSVKTVTTLDEFETLRTDWNTLAARDQAFFPFLCFDWFQLWLRHFLYRNILFILLLYREEELRIIAPFFIKKEKYKGVHVRKIELIGNVYSPLRHLLFSQSDDEEKRNDLSLLFEFLSQTYKDWDILDLVAIPEENDSANMLRESLGQKFSYTDYVCYGDWYLNSINYSGDDYIARLPDKLRKDIAYCRRRLQKMAPTEFRLITDGMGIGQHMDLYYDVYSRSWQKTEHIGPSFHRDLAKIAANNGWLRLGFLFHNSLPIASQFWISCHETSFILKTVYDQNYKKHSPGKILSAEMFKYVIDIDGVKTIDYVQGDETYKRDWTPERRERKGVMVYNKNLKGQYLVFLNNRLLPKISVNKYLRTIKEIVAKRLD